MNVSKIKTFPKINCNFNDIDKSKVQNTEKMIYERKLYYEKFGEIDFQNIDYQYYVEDLKLKLQKLNYQKAFVFIDPYEYKHIKISQIKDLLSNKKTEVLLWLPTQFMYRFETNGTPQALKDFIEEIVPYENWISSENASNFVRQLRDEFQIAIGSNYFVDHFTIQKDAATMFCLFFFTPHIKGFEKMLEAKWEIDTEQGKGWEYSGNTPSLFYGQKTNPLEDYLKKYMSEKVRTNGELYKFTLDKRFLPKHTNEVLYNWQQNGNLKVLLANGRDARKRAFYISYQHYKEEYSKVKFILN